MIFGHLEEAEQWGFLAGHPVWREAFGWLNDLPAMPEIGRYPLRGEEMFGLVMRYNTVAAEASRFESHRAFVDLQYTIAGGELIAWARASSLAIDGSYDKDQDLQFYKFWKPLSFVHKRPSHFSIYYPSDAHLPKIFDGTNREVFKAVIKIGRHLID